MTGAEVKPLASQGRQSIQLSYNGLHAFFSLLEMRASHSFIGLFDIGLNRLRLS